MELDEFFELMEEVTEEEFEDIDDDLRSNAPCDTYGMCAGTRCPQYYTVCHKPEAYRDPFN